MGLVHAACREGTEKNAEKKKRKKGFYHFPSDPFMKRLPVGNHWSELFFQEHAGVTQLIFTECLQPRLE